MAESGSKEVRDAIVAAGGKFVAAFDKGDAAGIAAFYTEGGQILPPNAGVVEGREAIQAFWQGAMDMGIASVKLETIEAEGHGDTAIEVGKYKLYAPDGQKLDAGKFIVIWKQEDGGWKLHRDIYNSSKPAPE
jgi:uncharacterized protein (TIGR02246 family)